MAFPPVKLNWPLTIHDGYSNRLATNGRLHVYTVKRWQPYE